jgi:ADP-heptose:LPS heptosyltransferase
MNAASLLSDLPSGARILVLRLRSIGDIVLLTPALRLLKEWRPDLRVSVLIESRFRQLLEGNPGVEEILHPGEGAGWKKLASRFAAVRELRRRKFALSIDLHGGPTSRFLTRFSGARRRIGFQHFRTPSLYNILVPDARRILGQPTIHTAEHQASAFFYLGLPRQEIPRARLFVSAGCEAWWDEKRTSLGITPAHAYAVIHPTALYETKQWAPEKFAQLGRYLEREAGLAPVYCCGPGEAAELDAIEQAAGAPIRRLEGTSLGQLAAALARASLFVGNDSGPAHMAAALARPLVVIFGSSSSPTWGPWPRPAPAGETPGPPSGARRAQEGPPALVVQNFYDCNPCPGDRCYRFARPECILSITFEQVRAAVEAVLAQSPPPRRPKSR